MTWLLLLPPVVLGLALLSVLLRFSPGARRAELAIGAPVLGFGVGLAWLAVVWGLVFVVGPMSGGWVYDVVGLADVLGLAVAAVVLVPVCALVAALWVRPTKGRLGR